MLNGSRLMLIWRIRFRKENKDFINIFCPYDSLHRCCQYGLTLKSVCKLISMTIYDYRARLTVTASYTTLIDATLVECTST